MTVTDYAGWVADGSPWKLAQPVADFAATMRRHGYEVGTLGAMDTHLDIGFPEDHAPFSHTPWPGLQPYPYVLALDVMPKAGLPGLAVLGKLIFDARMAGDPHAVWIKYMNWTDASGATWHDAWQPDHTRRASSDKGHIHISGRTDFVASHAAAGWDPLIREDEDMGTFVKIKDGGDGADGKIWYYDGYGRRYVSGPELFLKARVALTGSTAVVVREVPDATVLDLLYPLPAAGNPLNPVFPASGTVTGTWIINR